MKLLHLLLATTFVINPLVAFSQTTKDPATIAQLVTVQVNPAEGFGTPGGSGVIVAKEGNTYSVLTNHHVACLRTAEPASCKLAGTILTTKKKKYQVISIETLQSKTNEPDLAIVKFTSNDSYPVAVIGDSNQLKVGVDVFVYGFPAVGNKVAEERDGRLTKGYVVGFDSNPKNGYGLSYDARTWWGSSGSPLFDVDGRLIAIHGTTETSLSPIEGREVQTGINKGIPINLFKTSLQKGGNPKISLAIDTRPSSARIQDFAQPNDAHAFYKRGVINLNNRQSQLALNDLNQAIKLNSNISEYYYYRANARLGLDDKKGAIEDFSQSIKLNQSNEGAYIGLGVTLADPDGRIKMLNQALKINPINTFALNARANARHDLGDYKGAFQDANQALKIDPNSSAGYSIRANARFKLGDRQGAIEDLNQAIRINPKSTLVFNNRAFVRIGLGDYNGAFQDANQALKIDPNYAEAYNNRGMARFKLGDRQGAIEDYSQAIKIDPQAAKALTNRGVARSFLGDSRGAIEDYSQAIKINPQNADAYSSRGVARTFLGDRQGAIEDLTIASRLYRNQNKLEEAAKCDEIIRQISR